jgi:hypothetical protein
MSSAAELSSVRAALRDYLDECEQNGKEAETNSRGFCRVMEERMRMDFSSTYAWQEIQDRNRFGGQVRAVLNELAKDGTLVKRPGHGYLHYYLPAVAAELDAAKRARDDADAQVLAAKLEIVAKLSVLGIDAKAGRFVEVDIRDWERITEMLEER